MIQAWLKMWKNTFHYTGTVTRKEYWLALVANVIAMYIAVVPYALVLRNFVEEPTMAIIVYLIIVHLPTLSLYFRRGNALGWKKFSIFYAAVTLPCISALLVGFLPDGNGAQQSKTGVLKLMALGFALFFYSGILGIVLYDDPVSMPYMSVAGLLLITGVLIIWGIIHWREVVDAFLGRG